MSSLRLDTSINSIRSFFEAVQNGSDADIAQAVQGCSSAPLTDESWGDVFSETCALGSRSLWYLDSFSIESQNDETASLCAKAP